jgi:hypothetical protein
MSELEMTHDAETEAFTDELSDEALDREEGRNTCFCTWQGGRHVRSLVPVTDR